MPNRTARLSSEGETRAGATGLLDERWRRRPVGLVIAGTDQQTQPLLSESYYLESALQPFTELRKGTVDELLQRQIAVLALPDSVVLSAEERSRIAAWFGEGGLLLRFAGPPTAPRPPAHQPGADLLPGRLQIRRAAGRGSGGRP